MEEATCGAAHRVAPGRWRVLGTVRADFERTLVDPAIASAEIASELRRGADYVRVTVALAASTGRGRRAGHRVGRLPPAARDDLTG